MSLLDAAQRLLLLSFHEQEGSLRQDVASSSSGFLSIEVWSPSMHHRTYRGFSHASNICNTYWAEKFNAKILVHTHLQA
jgi:hypothetical protein